MKITDEMIEAGARAMHNHEYTCDLSERDGWLQDDYKEQARVCLEAALQTKLTEQDKLLEVMGEALAYTKLKTQEQRREIEADGFCSANPVIIEIAINPALAQYQSYKAGWE